MRRGRGRLESLGKSNGEGVSPRRMLAAMRRGELILHYQPKMSLSTGGVDAVEALVRWQPAGEDVVGPEEFVTRLEQSSVAERFNRYVLEEAIGQIAAWRRSGLVLRVAVNVSPWFLGAGAGGRDRAHAEAAPGAAPPAGDRGHRARRPRGRRGTSSASPTASGGSRRWESRRPSTTSARDSPRWLGW